MPMVSKSQSVPEEPITTNLPSAIPNVIEDYFSVQSLPEFRSISLHSESLSVVLNNKVIAAEFLRLKSQVATWQPDPQTTITDAFLKSIRAIDSYLTVISAHRENLGINTTNSFPTKCGFNGFFTIDANDINRAIGALTVLDLFGQQEKYLKNHTAYWLAKAFQQTELPPLPSGEDFELFDEYTAIFPSLSWRKWVKHCTSSPSGKCRYHRSSALIHSCFYNFYQAKNGTLPPSPKLIKEALAKHRKILSEPHPEILSDDELEILRDAIQRSTDEIFGRVRSHRDIYQIFTDENGQPQELKVRIPLNPNKDAIPPKRIPSLGASFGNMRSNGGALGEILGPIIEDVIEVPIDNKDDDEIDDPTGEDTEYTTTFNLPTQIFVGMTHAPNFRGKTHVCSIYATVEPEDVDYLELASRTFARNGHDRYTIGSDPDDIQIWRGSRRELMQSVWKRLLKGELSPIDICHVDTQYEEEKRQYCDKVHATVVPLLEAFKVRTITKGSASAYHLGRRWQKIIHSKMRKHPAAALMGQPASEDFLTERILKNEVGRSDHSFYVSGDYESATDNLDPNLSIIAQDAISRALNIPLEDQIVLNRILTQHHLYYKKSDADDQRFTSEQLWGQLMGSPASFPVLCLINLAATLVSFEQSFNRRFKLRELPMCVNGDDILFRSRDKHHYEIWKDITMKCGLKFSLGKNYTHKKILVINSEVYKVTRGNNAVRLPILNTRLLYGGNRSSSAGIQYPPSLEKKRLETTRDWTDEQIAVLLNGDLDKHSRNEIIERHLKKVRTQYFQSGPERRVQGERWFETLPQRQATFHKQLNGGFKVSESWLENAQVHFNDRQIRTYVGFFANAEKMKKIPSVHYHLPRSVGGLGLKPLANYRFTPLTTALYAVLANDEQLCKEYRRFIVPTMLKPRAMKVISLEIARLRETLNFQDLEIEIGDEWDEALERYGVNTEDATGRLIRGYLSKPLWLTSDDFGLGYIEAARFSQRPGAKGYYKAFERAKKLNHRWSKKNVQSDKGVPAELDLNSAVKRAELSTRVDNKILRMMPSLPRL